MGCFKIFSACCKTEFPVLTSWSSWNCRITEAKKWRSRRRVSSNHVTCALADLTCIHYGLSEVKVPELVPWTGCLRPLVSRTITVETKVVRNTFPFSFERCTADTRAIGLSHSNLHHYSSWLVGCIIFLPSYLCQSFTLGMCLYFFIILLNCIEDLISIWLFLSVYCVCALCIYLFDWGLVGGVSNEYYQRRKGVDL